jgi:hypothetical protein
MPPLPPMVSVTTGTGFMFPVKLALRAAATNAYRFAPMGVISTSKAAASWFMA